MSQLYNDISYIISYREASSERKQALQYTLGLLRQYFPNIEILIVEQDSESRLTLDESLNIRQLFVYNPGPSNRPWALNCAIKNTKKEFFVFADADVFLDKDGYIECFEATNDFEAITPNKREISNVAIGQGQSNEVQILNVSRLNSFASGMLIITRNAFEKIGGWDERFEGWGGENDAMSHLIYNRLISKTFDLPNYHIEHPHQFVSGNNQSKYKSNKALVAEILSRNGLALDKYIHQIKALDFGDPKKYKSSVSNELVKSQKFVLAITTYNRLEYLKKCVDSFFETRTETNSWQLIIADDNSTDGTKEYLKQLEDNHQPIIIRNNQTNIHHQVNTIIKALSSMTFDLCFRCDDDVVFIQKGWDTLYWNTSQRTGYHHLIFYDKKWQPYSNLSSPIGFGGLVSNCQPENLQGAFYTLTKEVIDKVGYFDEQQFGASGLGHVDFSFRCCRAGFNVLANPFDVEKSNDFIQLQAVYNYSSASTKNRRSPGNSKEVIALKHQLLGMWRIYVPYNENFDEESLKNEKSRLETRISKRLSSTKYRKADATFYPERGVSGFFGFVLKRTYNLSIDLRLNFVPAGINYLGKVLNKISIHLINIQQ